MGSAEEKKTLRRQMIAVRRGLVRKRRTEAETVITEALEHFFAEKNITAVLLYASTEEECATDGIARMVLASGRILAFPKVCGDEIVFYRVKELSELRPGYRGIREPSEENEKANPGKDPAGVVVVVPGCAFSEDGRRLGYGGGFYDRFLAKYPGIYRVGICYAEQLTEDLPVCAHDIRMDRVICG